MTSQKTAVDLDLHINRYHLSNSIKNDLLIKVKRSTKWAPVGGFLLFGGMAAFFGFITVHSYIKEGYHIMMVVMSFFCLFMSVLASAILIGAYSNLRSYHFRTNELVVTNSFGIKSTYNRQEVKSVFIKETLFAEQGKSADNYSYMIMLRMPLRKSRDLALFDIEGRDSLTYIIGMMDEKGKSMAQSESLEIAHTISDYWKIPVSI